MRGVRRVTMSGVSLWALILWCLPGQAAIPDLTINNTMLTLVSSARVSRTVLEVTYRARVSNAGSNDMGGVTATLTSLSPHTVVVEGALTFGDVPAGATVTSSDTFTIRHNRRFPFDPAALLWAIAGTPQAGPDGDVDGVADAIEDGAPNSGDGNNDGILDSQQAYVASLPNVVDGRYVTLAAAPGTTLVQVAAVPNPSPGNVPDGVELPIGLVAFQIQGLVPGDDTSVMLFLPDGVALTTYYKFGPTPDDPTPHWYDFAFDGTTGALFTADSVVLRFVDGQRGDDDLAANGAIVDQGGPAAAACGLAYNLAPGQTFRCALPIGPADASWTTLSALPPLLHLIKEGERWFIDGTIQENAPLETYPVDLTLVAPGRLIDARPIVFTLGLPFSVWTQNTILRPEDVFSGVGQAALCAAAVFTGLPVLITLCPVLAIIEAVYDGNVQNTNEDNEERTRLILDRLPSYDIIALQEAFDKPRLEQIIDDASTHFVIPGPEGDDLPFFPNTNSGLGLAQGIIEIAGLGVNITDLPKTSAGLALAVRRGIAPLLQQLADAVLGHRAEVYNDCTGDDCLARKGFTLDTVHLGTDPDAFFFVVNTHLNAGSGPEAEAVRRNQLAQLKAFLDANTDTRHPIILLGDFNIADFLVDDFNIAVPTDEYNALLRILDLNLEDDVFRTFRPGPPFIRLTGDPLRNAYVRNWFSDGIRQRLDYILIRQGRVYRIDTDFTLMTDESINTALCGSEGWIPDAAAPSLQCYLSDHFGIAARLRLTKRRAVEIRMPAEGAIVLEGQNVQLLAVFRPDLTQRTAVWTSDRGGQIALDTIADWVAVAPGPHILTVRLNDASGVTGTDSVAITVLADRDRDGLSDEAEPGAGTDPDDPDTDDDGLLDGREVELGSHPLIQDSDNDGLLDGEEVNVHGTAPTTPDSDGDGIEDGAEIVLGSNPTSRSNTPTEIPTGTLLASRSGQGGTHLVVIDPATGRLGRLGQPNGGLGFGLAFDEKAALFIGGGARLALHDPVSDLTTDVGPFIDTNGSPITITQMAYSPADQMLYGVEDGPAPNFLPTGQLVRIDRATGTVTRIGVPLATPIHALTFTPQGILYAAVADPTSDRFIELDPATGLILRDIGPIGASPIFGLATLRTGELVAAHRQSNDASQLLTIDLTTGAGTPLATVRGALFGLTVMPCPAPCLEIGGFVAVFGSAVALGDLNHDNHLDIVTANGDVLLGDGTGRFTRNQFLPGGTAVALGDLDGDSNLDVVIFTAFQGNPPVLINPTLNIHLGHGNGLFDAQPTAQVEVAQGGGLGDIVIADVTNDSRPDILVVSSGQVRVVVRDNATGAFALAARSFATTGLPALAVGDLNGDGATDVVVANTTSNGTLTLHLSDGAGGFAPPAHLTAFLTGARPAGVAITDLNSDLALDVAVSSSDSNTVVILFGDGVGSFPTRTEFPLAGGGLAIGDLTGDGNPDLVTAGGSSGVFVLVGNGSGGFTPAVNSPYRVFDLAFFVALGDLNGDALLDVVAPGEGITVLLNHPSF